ncbi:uncharacterized protein LOC131037510 isoform X1 [Cryptomeria japonica]|uniref:uncharacterized protein LOC131037510 isoform X1 n=1 Tax=Cryptomeria japonica TaxID=3369 RepID=UPI0027DA4995|nr:uncharacterized protein LOC131037510 isoform X1 [Cryptomeria japonica]
MGTNIETVVKKYEIEIWECLEMLRSASDYNAEESKSRGWKLKQDNDEFRVMYREGPQGTPFHTLLVEGYINGPLDSCLCVGLESSLYPHWWPQFTVPTFKILESRCLKKIHIGEELSLVRMKIPWPLLPREMIFRYFELEYFEEDSVFVLLKSVSDSQLDNNINGFSSEDIPPANGTVRMDLMGGFALQKVDSAQSYFRTIVNLDIKLDFVPPSLINFISRQLIGHGYKLYQKSVLAASSGEGKFREILEHGPMYIRIREGLRSSKETKEGNVSSTTKEVKKSNSVSTDEVVNGEQIKEWKTKGKAVSTGLLDMTTLEGASTSRIELFSRGKEAPQQGILFSEKNNIEPQIEVNTSYIDPDIQKALQVLDGAIAFVKTHGQGEVSQIQAMSPIVTSESHTASLNLKGISDSEPDQHCNGNTLTSFLPGWKVTEKLEKIGSRNGFARIHNKEDEDDNFIREINKVEHDVPSSAKVRSKKPSCFAFLCL